jgi:hypothetical protein
MQNEIKYQLSPKINRKKSLLTLYVHQVLLPDLTSKGLLIFLAFINLNQKPIIELSVINNLIVYQLINLSLFLTYQLFD